jgi:hypothetical protein
LGSVHSKKRKWIRVLGETCARGGTGGESGKRFEAENLKKGKFDRHKCRWEGTIGWLLK